MQRTTPYMVEKCVNNGDYEGKKALKLNKTEEKKLTQKQIKV
jgi:hypothetical protein